MSLPMPSPDATRALDSACSRLREAQADLAAACENLAVLLADPAYTPPQRKRGLRRTWEAGQQAQRLTAEYMAALAVVAAFDAHEGG